MMLEPWEGLRVVDLYAGSGALGIEALSRGAAWADFAEASRQALAALERNLEALELGERAGVWRKIPSCDIWRALPRTAAFGMFRRP